ncbi:hypothetical protein SADUNF_Sadunf16G0245400 [Salix dunnii]|uniref:Reverse transcriptase Ty1/copia-type domain-containing protein n=1 Tax=Salix dunnii TaxID=1413687 RepID=A0A835JAL8_9ROSI|nr:hypothetical protein SADUNF_Sadunf16G0245400 [Salix dunnii]
MDDEFSTLMKNGTWSLVLAYPDMNVIGSMWVLKSKRRSNDTIDRRKAHLVAKGYHKFEILPWVDLHYVIRGRRVLDETPI